MDTPTLIQVGERMTITLLLLTIIWSGVKTPPWWVPYDRYAEKAKEADYWRDQAVSGTALAEEALTIAERKRRRSGGSD